MRTNTKRCARHGNEPTLLSTRSMHHLLASEFSISIESLCIDLPNHHPAYSIQIKSISSQLQSHQEQVQEQQTTNFKVPFYNIESNHSASKKWNHLLSSRRGNPLWLRAFFLTCFSSSSTKLVTQQWRFLTNSGHYTSTTALSTYSKYPAASSDTSLNNAW